MKKVKLGLLCLLAGVVLSACNKEKEGYSKKSDYKETAFDMDLSMVYVEGGTFMMGATAEQGSDAYDYEKPAHKVTLSSYHISKCEITQAQWKAVMGVWPYESEWGMRSEYKGDSLPIMCVTWFEAVEFCVKLSNKTGKKYALPTEAQWEFAARGGTKSKGYKYSGSNMVSEVAWYLKNSGSSPDPDPNTGSYEGLCPHAVGTKAPNELGIYDMSGNVWEWCADWGGKYSSADVTNPEGPTSGEVRVVRGGTFASDAMECRVSDRTDFDCFDPAAVLYELGFRVVCIP